MMKTHKPYCVFLFFFAFFHLSVFAQNPAPEDADETDVLWQIGTPDGRSAEFRRWLDWEKMLPQKEAMHRFRVGEHRASDWVPQHLSTRDFHAAGHQFTVFIEFPLEKTVVDPLYFIVGSCHGHLTEPSLMKISVNGHPLPPERLPCDFKKWEFNGGQDTGQFYHTQFVLPPETLKAGKNELSITLEDGSWIFYDYLALRQKPGALAIKPISEMLQNFRKPGGPMNDVPEVLFAVKKPGEDPHWYANFGYYAADKDKFPFPLGEGGALRILNLETGETRTIFHDPAGNVRDPQVHYDGRKAIFSYLPAGKRHYNLYEINLDGSGLRQITHGDWDDVEATYLPNGDIIFTSSRAKCWVQCWLTGVATLHRCGPDGENIHRITSNPEQENTPWVLPDGRIIYMRWEYIDRSQVHYHHLWATNPDGTKQNIYYGNLVPGIVMLGAKPVRNAKPDAEGRYKVVCTFSPGHGIKEHYGAIALVDPRNGPDDPKSVKQISVNEWSHADPWAFSEEAFMVASYNRLLILDADGREQAIYSLPQAEKDAGFWISDPQPIITRPREMIIQDQTDDSQEYGTLAMVDIYEGRRLGGLEKGTVKELLILEPLPEPVHYNGGMQQISSGGTFSLERIVGTVPVAEDGSAFMELPAKRSFFFVAMDAEGNPVKRMHSFTTVMPGESAVCIGCHEQRTTAPPRDNDYRLMRVMSRPPVRPEPVKDVPEVMDFVRDIQPILDKHCVECHHADRAEGGMDLSGDMRIMYNISYQTLSWRQMLGDNRNRPESDFQPYEIGSSASTLVKLVESGHPDKDGNPRVDVSPLERKRIRYWIEAGANYAGTYAANATGTIYWTYYETPVKNDVPWPETPVMHETVIRRCEECHGLEGKIAEVLPGTLSGGGRRYNSAVIFNFTHPEKSLMLRGPLSRDAGGYGKCYRLDADGKHVPVTVFADKNDPDYQKILACIVRGQKHLTVDDPRWWMPNYAPNAPYIREMKRYGVLPADYIQGTPLNPWETDEKYWRSQWHQKK